MEGGSVGHNFERDPSKDHPCQVCFNLVQGFQRRRFKCESLRRTTDGRTMDAKWWQMLTWTLTRWAKNEQNDKHGIFIDWDIEGSFFVWFYYVFRLYSSEICIFANHTGWSWVSDSGHYLTIGFSRLVTFNPPTPSQFVNMTELLTTVIQVGGLTRRKTWFNPPFSWEMPVPSREYDSCFLVSHLVMS
jgi:hypothetical protein